MPSRIAGPCPIPNCPGRATHRGRCEQHQVRQRPRSQRGYGSEHDALRAHYQRRMDAGQTFLCWRCDDTIDPTNWRLGHDDADRSVYRGPECTRCNQATAGRRRAAPRGGG